MDIKTDWRRANWVEKLTIIFLVLTLFLIIVAAIGNWQGYVDKSNAISTMTTGQAKQQYQLLEDIKM